MKRLFFVFLSVPVFAQTVAVNASPDCTLTLPASTTTGISPVYDNRPESVYPNVPCTQWILVAKASTSNVSFSVRMESAQDNGSVACSTCTFSIFGAALTSDATSAKKSAPADFIQIHLTAINSGNVSATLNGWRDNAGSIGASSSTGCPNPCPVEGTANAGSPPVGPPVQVGGSDGTNMQTLSTDTSGRTKVIGGAAVGASESGNPVPQAQLDGANHVIIPTLGTVSARINLSSVTGENQIIALSGTTVIRIAHISVSMSAASTVSIDVGTGSNCAAATATIWGPYPSNTTSFSLDLEPSMLAAPAGDAICLNFGGTVTAGGGVTYAQY